MAKRIGILTSGGDCAGLNAVIRAVTLRAVEHYHWDVIGIRQGTMGLIHRPVHANQLTVEDVDTNLLRLGGTILGTTNKGDPFAFPVGDGTFIDHSSTIIEGIKELKLDAVIGVGGDGSMEILNRLMQQGGVNFIGIPKTIDNDIGITERSIGFSTAVGVATEALDRLQPTAASHDRAMILEVMGRDAGHIALHAGIAGGADVILIPEIPYKLECIAAKIKSLFKTGRNFALIVVAEAVKKEAGESAIIEDSHGRKRYGGISYYLSEKIEEMTGAETRFTVLGHVQRGAQPDATDRVLAAALGVRAVDLIAEEKYNRVVVWQNRTVKDVTVAEVVASYQAVNPQDTLVKTARGLGICLGDQ